jgi:2-C-methyl-D-erythritol 4-phosphate cytidylyltransferase
MATVAVVIPAAGKSSRFGGLQKKTFVPLEGRAVWQRTAELFWNRQDVFRVYVVVAPDDREFFRSKYGHVMAFANADIVTGGAERFESVANALAKIPSEVDFVAVHDAVRPLTPPELIDSVFHAAFEHGAAMLAIPVADTLKRVDAESQKITETVPRAGLWAAQTPQVFRREWLVEAYARREELGSAITDDAQLVEALGHPVHVVPGSPLNFKITTPDDISLATLVLNERLARPAPTPAHPYDDDVKW